MKKPYDEDELITELQRLYNNWPDGYFLTADVDNSLILSKSNPRSNGELIEEVAQYKIPTFSR